MTRCCSSSSSSFPTPTRSLNACVNLGIAARVRSWSDLDEDVLAAVFTFPPSVCDLETLPLVVYIFLRVLSFPRMRGSLRLRLPFTAYPGPFSQFLLKWCSELPWNTNNCTRAPVRVPRLSGPGWYLAHSFINIWQRANSFVFVVFFSLFSF